jgi:hypothetical protein
MLDWVLAKGSGGNPENALISKTMGELQEEEGRKKYFVGASGKSLLK